MKHCSRVADLGRLRNPRMHTLEDQRRSFIQGGGRFLAFPIAGALVWLVVGLASLVVPASIALYILLFATGAIFPLALLVAKITKQQVFPRRNPFGSLMGMAVLMVNLLWALHVILVLRAPALAPLAIALALGIHWIVFGWIIQSAIGLVHAVARCILCTASFLLFPQHSVCAVALPVVLCYAFTIFQLSTHFSRENGQAAQ